MRHLKKYAWLLALLLLSFAPPADAQRVIRLTVGQSETLRVRGVIKKVQVLNPSVADVATYTTKAATVVGVNGGSTEVHISAGKRKYKFTIVVTAVEASSLYKQVRSFLGRIEGIYPRLFGGSVILTGHALTAEDYGRAQEAVRLFGNKVQNQVRFRKSAVQQVNQIFRRAGLGNVQVNLIGGTLFLEGAVSSKKEMEKVEALLRTFGLNAENLLAMGGGRQILVDVQFIEMRKRGSKQIGVKWPASFSVSGEGFLTGTIPIMPAGGNKLDFAVSAPFKTNEIALNMLFSNGSARLLAQPKLVCGSGKEADFLVGGEIPIVYVNEDKISIEWKEYGIKLKVKPVADSRGNIQSEIYAQVSEPDWSVAIQKVPGFRVRQFKTDVTVKDGASIVLSGLFTNSDQKTVDKFPFLGHIPIIGELFKSRDFQDQKTTLVVYVTLKVVRPDHPWVQSTIEKMKQMYKDYEDEVGWQLFD